MKLMREILVFIFLAAMLSVSAQTKKNSNLVYEANSNGERTFGSIDSLTNAIQMGKQIRVGFSMGSVEHWVDAGFLTIYEGHVFAQIEGIFIQTPSISRKKKIPKIEFGSKEDDSWAAVIGTTGVLQMHWNINEEKLFKVFKTKTEIDDYLKSLEKLNVDTKWAAF